MSSNSNHDHSYIQSICSDSGSPVLIKTCRISYIKPIYADMYDSESKSFYKKDIGTFISLNDGVTFKSNTLYKNIVNLFKYDLINFNIKDLTDPAK